MAAARPIGHGNVEQEEESIREPPNHGRAEQDSIGDPAREPQPEFGTEFERAEEDDDDDDEEEEDEEEDVVVHGEGNVDGAAEVDAVEGVTSSAQGEQRSWRSGLTARSGV